MNHGERQFRAPIRFGAFEADLQAEELTRSGAKIRLQHQPFQVLAALLERPGEVIGRDELQRRIWATDTFVDFDRGLNKAINRLRSALGDSAAKPTIIETLGKRGYRFIASVERSIQSVAILPLENLSGDSSHDYWAEGITDELIVLVAKSTNARVISLNSVMRFKNSSLPLPQIASELGADAVIQGSILIGKGRIRLRAHLVEAHTDRHLWADSYESELGDALMVQVNMAKAVANCIRPHLMPQIRVNKDRKVMPEVYDLYLRGRFLWNKRTKDGIERGIDCFDRALKLDPSNPVLYSGLADAYVVLSLLGFRPPRDVCPKAKVAAEKALSLDESIAEAHNSLAVIKHLYEWNWEEAEEGFKRSLDLNPSSAVAHQWYAMLLSSQGRNEEAIVEVTSGRNLDPTSLVSNGLKAIVQMKAGRSDDAVQTSREAIELDQYNPFGHWILARALDACGLTEEALRESQEAVRLSGGELMYRAHLGYSYARSQKRTQACEVLDWLAGRSKAEYVTPLHFALIHAALGDTDQAFEALENCVEERTPRLAAGELFDRSFESLQGDRRFEAIVHRFPSSRPG